MNPWDHDYTWHSFVPWLVQQKGLSEQKARTIVGRVAKYVPKQTIWYFLSGVVKADPAEPVSYLAQLLKPYTDGSKLAKTPAWKDLGYESFEAWQESLLEPRAPEPVVPARPLTDGERRANLERLQGLGLGGLFRRVQ